jgi:hypothetical protein
MKESEIPRAVAAGRSVATTLDLTVDDAVVVHYSNRLAVRLRPCEVLARVAHVEAQDGAELEVRLAQRLGEIGSPVAELEPLVEPRVYLRGGFAVTLWTHYEAVAAQEIAPSEYAHALKRLHAGMRDVDVTVPHFTDRVASAESLVHDPEATPNLPVQDRELLIDTLASLRDAVVDRGADEQLLHGEPHPGNLLSTESGLLFVDLETCCRGPVEFDIAHAPDEVGQVYRGADPDLLHDCRILALAVATTWRWDRNDQLPNGRQLGVAWLTQIRAGVDG